MKRRLLGLVTGIVVVVGAANAGGGIEGAGEVATARCRRLFPDVVSTIDAAGGIAVDVVDGRRLLCLYGNLGGSDLTRIGGRGGPGFDVVVVRSTGGPVAVWLTLAELLVGRVDRLVVDEACFSSCADYTIPLAHTVTAKPNSLIVWHGGPTLATLPLFMFALGSVGDLINHLDLIWRTERLYRRLGLSTKILSDTARTPIIPGNRPPLGHLDGYAPSPERLKRCWGFQNVEKMWHAGDENAVKLLAEARNNQLVILESPFLGSSGCAFSVLKKK